MTCGSDPDGMPDPPLLARPRPPPAVKLTLPLKTGQGRSSPVRAAASCPSWSTVNLTPSPGYRSTASFNRAPLRSSRGYRRAPDRPPGAMPPPPCPPRGGASGADLPAGPRGPIPDDSQRMAHLRLASQRMGIGCKFVDKFARVVMDTDPPAAAHPVAEEGVNAVALRNPTVLRDEFREQFERQFAFSVQTHQPPDKGCVERRNAHRVVQPRADVADTHLHRRVPAVKADRIADRRLRCSLQRREQEHGLPSTLPAQDSGLSAEVLFAPSPMP